MNEIYWITRLDAISSIASFCCFCGGLGAFVAIVCTCIGMMKDTAYESYELPRKMGKLLTKIFATLFAVGLLIDIFVPTTKEALVIYAVGGGLDYIKADSTAQQLPKKVIDACDAYLDELLKDK